MKVMLSGWMLAVLMSAAYAASLPGDSANGQRLYEANCTGCHDNSVMTRQNRSVQSLEALQEQFENCAHMANAHFSESEAQDVLKYLNDEFYHFR
jgi:hypothetical protein